MWRRRENVSDVCEHLLWELELEHVFGAFTCNRGQKQGSQVFPIDFHRNRFSPKCRILDVDMTHPEGAGQLTSMVTEINQWL